MNLIIYVLLIVLWSSITIFAPALANEKVKSNTSTPIASEAFTLNQGLTFVDDKNSRVLESKNMPTIQSQDTVGSCFGCASATIVQKFFCDSDPEIKRSGKACNELPNEKIISQFSLVAWADINNNKDDPKRSDVDKKDFENHKNIKLYSDRSNVSSGSNALRDSLNEFKFMPESCFPFDQLVSKYGSKDSSLFKNAYEKTRKLYEKMKSKTESASLQCEECLAQLSTDFNTNKISKEIFFSAMKKNTFGEFLHELLFYNCSPLSSSKRPKYNQFPPGKDQTADKALVFEKMKEILNKDKPVLLSSICLEYSSDRRSCKHSHDTVASGYRRVCPSENYSSNACKNEIKLHNCWGQDWQNLNNNGWVDADNLIKHLNEGRTYIDAGDLSWLE